MEILRPTTGFERVWRLDGKLVSTCVSVGQLVGISRNGVEGLMNVAHEMKDESERLSSIFGGLRHVGEDVPEFFNRPDHVFRIGLVGRGFSVGPEMEVDVVPLPGITPLATDVVRPASGAQKVAGSLRTSNFKEVVGLNSCGRSQSVVSDLGDDHVARIDPCVRQ
jgi:hypothetical protein